MIKSKVKSIVIKPESNRKTRIFGAVCTVLAFAVLYLLVISALSSNVARYLGVLPGMALAAAWVVLEDKKYSAAIVCGAAALYAVICVCADVGAFVNGAHLFRNAVVQTVNENTARGWKFAAAYASGAAEFQFCSVVGCLSALAVTVLCEKRKFLYILCGGIELIIIIALGLYPSPYMVAFTVLLGIMLLTAAHCFGVRSAGCYLAVATACVLLSVACFTYSGSKGVKNFRSTLSDALNALVYGNDSLPDGKLYNADGMHKSDREMLRVTATAQASTLYLKGFVGANLDGNEWQPTNKNLYVSDGYQGLVEYLSDGGLPVSQYAEYSTLLGNADKYGITVDNVGASRKYVYYPYTAREYSAGKQNYDMNLCADIFTPRKYSYTVFNRDESSERTVQADWILNAELRTVAMNDYMKLEEEYRAFVYDAYTAIGDDRRAAIDAVFGDKPATYINTVTTAIRAVFLDAYSYSDDTDVIDSDFITEFFGGKLNRANSSYFASAAAYVFRYYGFASRYVEGYLVKGEEQSAVYEVSVTGKDAHAWTEVYFDGIGWLPIEVTPTYFSDDWLNTTVDPESPDAPASPDTGVTPTNPSEDDKKEPVRPVEPPSDTATKDKYHALGIAMKALIPVTGVMLLALAAALAVAIRRQLKLNAKRKKLETGGEEFGRAAFGIVQSDCRHLGEFNGKTLGGYGVSEEHTERFNRIIERCVYGGYEPNQNEKIFVYYYINRIAEGVSDRGGAVNRFVCKYLRCVGI